VTEQLLVGFQGRATNSTSSRRLGQHLIVVNDFCGRLGQQHLWQNSIGLRALPRWTVRYALQTDGRASDPPHLEPCRTRWSALADDPLDQGQIMRQVRRGLAERLELGQDGMPTAWIHRTRAISDVMTLDLAAGRLALAGGWRRQ